MVKKPWQSKTYWSNLGAAALLPVIGYYGEEWAAQHPLLVPSVLIVMNLVLRHFTEGKVTLGKRTGFKCPECGGEW